MFPTLINYKEKIVWKIFQYLCLFCYEYENEIFQMLDYAKRWKWGNNYCCNIKYKLWPIGMKIYLLMTKLILLHGADNFSWFNYQFQINLMSINLTVKLRLNENDFPIMLCLNTCRWRIFISVKLIVFYKQEFLASWWGRQ